MKIPQGKLDEARARGLARAREDFKRLEPQYQTSPSLYTLHFNLYREDAERLEMPCAAVRRSKFKEYIDKTEVAAYVQEYFQLIQTISPPSA